MNRKAADVYNGSDGAVTKAFYSDLEARGPIGMIAMNLFRAHKCSSRAKVYRGGVPGKGSYRKMAYERKQWSMDNLAAILEKHAEALKIVWGWQQDPKTPFGQDPSWVLYVDIPDIGQASFHSPNRGRGPKYSGEWDGKHESAYRILRFCDLILQREVENQGALPL